MAPDNNWLSFSLSPMEMLSSSTSQPYHHHQQQILHSSPADSQQYYFFDNFYAPNAGWPNPKVEVMYNEGGNHHLLRHQVKESVNDSSFIFTSFETNPPPKLEDFLGGDTTSSYVHRYSDTQTETTQDSSLTHIYDHSDLKTIAAFQAFSTNSGSEVDDSASVGRTQLEFAGQSIESGNELVAYQQCPTGGVLSLAVNNHNNNNNGNQGSENAIVSVDSDSCKKIADTFGQRTSIYRGVTRHRWTGRYEAHLWDNSCRREGQARKGRQVYLGGYDKEDKAARAYDLAALKYWGPTATTNFPVSNYTKEQEEMKNVTKQEFIASLRRKSSGFSRGASIYRGVTRHHQQGRWQARIGRVAGNKDLYLGTFATEEEAAEAYDIAAIKFRGVNAVTNFEMNRYDVEAIAKSALPIGGAAKRLKLSLEAEQKPSLSNNHNQQSSSNSGSSISFAAIPPVSAIPYGVPFDSTTPYYHQNLLHPLQSSNAGMADTSGSTTPYYHQNLLHPLQSSNAGMADTSGSMSSAITPVPLLPPPAEFFLWPHQSY